MTSGLLTLLVVGPGLKALDTESGGHEESADHLQLHIKPFVVTTLEDTLGSSRWRSVLPGLAVSWGKETPGLRTV